MAARMVIYFSRPNCYVFVCPPCTPPELEIIQVKHKDHSHCHVMNYIYLYYTLPGLGPFLNNEIIQGRANLRSALHGLKNRLYYRLFALVPRSKGNDQHVLIDSGLHWLQLPKDNRGLEPKLLTLSIKYR